MQPTDHTAARARQEELGQFLTPAPVADFLASHQYFRRFSGHTQVNAADLRKLAYPDLETLQNMGRQMATLDLAQDEIDQLVSHHLHAS